MGYILEIFFQEMLDVQPCLQKKLNFVDCKDSFYLHLDYDKKCGLHCSVGYNTTLLQALWNITDKWFFSGIKT